MASFLQLLAKDIIRKYGTDFADLTIIFPNKRAGLFLPAKSTVRCGCRRS